MGGLGERLRLIRVAHRLPQVRVATAAGISRSRLSEIELCKVPPPPPKHALYEVVARLAGERPGPLQRHATLERRVLIEGIPWRKRTSTR